MDLSRFPALTHLATLRGAFAAGTSCVIVEAGTGSGKSTALVRELARRRLDQLEVSTLSQEKNEGWFLSPSKRILLVEPRRLAAKTIANFIDTKLRDPADQDPAWSLAGYSTRFESRFHAATRILVVTGGVFLRCLLDDPFLSGVECLVLDEFHERLLETDFALAWAIPSLKFSSFLQPWRVPHWCDISRRPWDDRPASSAKRQRREKVAIPLRFAIRHIRPSVIP